MKKNRTEDSNLKRLASSLLGEKSVFVISVLENIEHRERETNIIRQTVMMP